MILAGAAGGDALRAIGAGSCALCAGGAGGAGGRAMCARKWHPKRTANTGKRKGWAPVESNKVMPLQIELLRITLLPLHFLGKLALPLRRPYRS